MRTLGIVLVFSLSAVWGEVRNGMLVTPAELAAKLNDPATVVVHAGAPKDYAEGHIPGARLLTMSDVTQEGEGALRVELPPIDTLRQAFLRAGVRDGVRVVLYGPAIVQVTRTWFTLDYLGLGANASILNGGLAAWKAEGRPLSQEAVAPGATDGALTVRPRPELVVDAAWLAGRLQNGGVRVIDARLPEFYKGEQSGMNMPRAGHIPGAANVPYTSLVDAHQKFLAPDALREKVGAHTAPVVYCHIGMQATVAYFAASYLGMAPRLYDGSWQDWSRRAELPIATGEGK